MMKRSGTVLIFVSVLFTSFLVPGICVPGYCYHPGLLYSTYIGGTSQDLGLSIDHDRAGNVYITGKTRSTDFPTIIGSYDMSYDGGGDAVISKLSAEGTRLIFSTYLGGSGDDEGNGIALDVSGDCIITGRTQSSDFPTTFGSFDTIPNGSWDAFVCRITSDESGIAYSTLIGGSGYDSGGALSIDDSGNVYLTGWTASSDFPTTSGAFSTALAGGREVFVTALSADGKSLVYSTFAGGTGNEQAYSITSDTAGNAYVTGRTESSDFPVVTGSHDTTHNGLEDVFVLKINNAGSAMIFSTFLGGTAGEYGYDIAIDTGGYVYVTGWTESDDFDVTAPVFDRKYNKGGGDCFISKLQPDGSGLVFSTYFGAEDYDSGQGIAVDDSGRVFVTGSTYSYEFPTTYGAIDTSYNGGTTADTAGDAFVSELSADGRTLLYSTYLGGTNYDTGRDISLDASGAIYITGTTYSDNFRVTYVCYDKTYNGGSSVLTSGDIFAVKLEPISWPYTPVTGWWLLFAFTVFFGIYYSVTGTWK